MIDKLNKRFEDTINFIKNNTGEELFGYPLLDQQLLTVYRLLHEEDRRFFLNYSDTGAGKTKAAIAVTYYAKAQHILIICPCQVKDNAWGKSLKEIKCIENKKVSIDRVITKYNNITYEIFNYDKFNNDIKAERLIKSIINSKKYDIIIFDEAHRLKNKESNTYQNIFKMTQIMRKQNPDLIIIGATATPITISNNDLQGIYEIMSGKCAEELVNGTEMNKLINANKVLETSGFGYFPKSKMSEVRYNGISGSDLFGENNKEYKNAFFASHLCNIDGSSIELDCIDCGKDIIKREELHMMLKFNSYKHLITKGTTIFTEYTCEEYFTTKLKELVGGLGFKAAIYSGEEKNYNDNNSIEAFINGKCDVLIGTKAMCEGVDGLQKVCNKLILHNIPSLWSAFHQLIGRFDRRGSNFIDEGIDVYVPMVMFADKDGKKIGFDKRRWNIMDLRRLKDSITKGGHLDIISDIDKSKMVDEVIDKLKTKFELANIERKSLEVDLDFADKIIEQKESIINRFNSKGKLTNPSKLHNILKNDPSEWIEYHKYRRESMKNWPEIPYEYIASKIKNKRHIVGDFGCGENKMKIFIPENKVYGFDHVAIDDSVISCNMENIPMDNESLDVAVFSLSISWGNTFHENYIKEANRLLTYGGTLYIAEPNKAYNEDDKNNLIKILESNGFGIISRNGKLYEDRGKFFYITATKE